MADEQELFLIEFLVEKVKIPVIRAMQDDLLPACTCVSFQVIQYFIKFPNRSLTKHIFTSHNLYTCKHVPIYFFNK